MTREEAIKHMYTYSTTNGSGQTSQAQHEEAKRMAIKALEQEPCEDSISRQAVAEFLRDHSKDFEDARIKMAFMAASSLVENTEYIPPVTPTQGWIPVSERPPEDGEEILMNTVHFGVITGVYDSEFDFMTHYSLSSADMASVEVVAWMHLPEPYRAESEE